MFRISPRERLLSLGGASFSDASGHAFTVKPLRHLTKQEREKLQALLGGKERLDELIFSSLRVAATWIAEGHTNLPPDQVMQTAKQLLDGLEAASRLFENYHAGLPQACDEWNALSDVWKALWPSGLDGSQREGLQTATLCLQHLTTSEGLGNKNYEERTSKAINDLIVAWEIASGRPAGKGTRLENSSFKFYERLFQSVSLAKAPSIYASNQPDAEHAEWANFIGACHRVDRWQDALDRRAKGSPSRKRRLSSPR